MSRSEAAKKAWETRRKKGWKPQGSSEAAKKAWETRRKKGLKSLSEAAKKAWATRRAKYHIQPKPKTKKPKEPIGFKMSPAVRNYIQNLGRRPTVKEVEEWVKKNRPEDLLY